MCRSAVSSQRRSLSSSHSAFTLFLQLLTLILAGAVMLSNVACWASSDILMLVFDIVAFIDLLVASRVCRRWRSLTFGHVRFWRDINITACSLSALDLFVARLSHTSRGHPRVRVVLTHLMPKTARKALYHTILPTIAGHLYRIDVLSLAFSALCSRSVHRYLSKRDAPCLRVLKLHVSPLPVQGPMDSPLPKGWLTCACPQLVELRLTNFDSLFLSLIGGPLLSVRMVTLTCNQQNTELSLSVLEQLPNLCRFAVEGSGYLVPHTIAKEGVEILTRLQRLDLDCNTGVCSFFAQQVWINDIPHLCLSCDASLDYVSLVQALPGHLEVAFECDDVSVETVFRCTSTQKMRVLRTSLTTFRALTTPRDWAGNGRNPCGDSDEDPPQTVLGLINISVRIRALSIPAHAWPTISRALMCLDSCDRLTVSFSDVRPLTSFVAPAPVLHCPALAIVVLKADGNPLRLDADDVAGFLRGLLSPSGPIRLHLDGAVLGGDLQHLRRLGISEVMIVR